MSLIQLFRKKYKNVLFTTPSHSQRFFITSKFEQFYKYDISETDTQNPQEALIAAEKRASEIYGTKQTLFLTNGSTSGIIASVLACVEKDDNVLIWDNAHPCHKNAVELAGANPIFYSLERDEEWGIYKDLKAENLEKYLRKYKVRAVIITSPSYEGIVCDVALIKNICEKYKVYLIVDEAHGALYPFCDKLPQSAVNISDFTVQSLHKTAGGFNPTALLHTNTELNVREALAKINTTSPSYAMLMSIEKNINYLNSKKGRAKIEELINNIELLKQNCKNVEFFNADITKILIKKEGLSGFELSEKLYENGIEDEKTNEKSTMLLCGIGTDKQKLLRLEKVLKFICK
ncbi:aminotransferase class I/II-fold pyridoxal phosphate-dependent enzyme [bacterium]|nr:aminotransferase class I/II-fold pyridoxal phosphate-dependent enzyme [bacterium]